MSNRKWQATTSDGVVSVWAESEKQARSRAKWKAAHEARNFRNRAEEMIAVRDCEVYRITEV